MDHDNIGFARRSPRRSPAALIVTILLAAVAIIAGAVFGIVLPIMSSARSGESVTSLKLDPNEPLHVQLDPGMNPLRISLEITYDAPGRRTTGHHSHVSAALHLDENEIWTLETGFDDRRSGEEERYVSAGQETYRMNLQEFVVDKPGSYQLTCNIDLHESFTLIDASLDIRRNITPIDGRGMIAWIILIPIGIAIILIAAIRWARRVAPL